MWRRLGDLKRGFSTSHLPINGSNKSRYPRFNEINIQLLPESLHKQIFERGKLSETQDGGFNLGALSTGNTNITGSPESREDDGQLVGTPDGRQSVKTLDGKKLNVVKRHLEEHKLWDIKAPARNDVDLDLPEFLGDTIAEHFRKLGERQVEDYIRVADQLCKSVLPSQPTQWAYLPGWVCYKDGMAVPVDFPDEGVLVFDVEMLVKDGNYPVLATAVSDKHWYSWCSDYLVMEKFRWSQGVQLHDLIPLETALRNKPSSPGKPKLIIGHNVGFDRSFVKEQYYIKKSKLRFMDTMSMHIAVCGLTNFQRVLYRAGKTDSQLKTVLEYRQKQRQRGNVIIEDWKEISTLNNLRDVHQLHVGGKPVDKDPRDIFVEGTMTDVRENFQDLMAYCASDVVATTQVFYVLWPEFKNRFPHPVTLAGMMEMSSGYLPVNQNWERYKHQSNNVYEDMMTESKQLLVKLASDACQYMLSDRYKDDPWLWDLDWTVKPFKIKKSKPLTKKQQAQLDEDREREWSIEDVLVVQDKHYKTGNNLIGYPEWYRVLCQRFTDEDWSPGPTLSSQTRVTPKLLRLTWDGYPLHYDDTHGWGYLVPGRTDNLVEEGEEVTSKERQFPYKAMCKMLNFKPDEDDCNVEEYDMEDEHQLSDHLGDHDSMPDQLFEEMMQKMLNGVAEAGPETYRYISEMKTTWDEGKVKRKHKKKVRYPSHVGDGPYNSVNIPGCWFFKMPHKDGKEKRVGNPLSKSFLNRLEDGTLSAHYTCGADLVLKLQKSCSYWKNNQKRITSQMSVWLPEEELPDVIKRSSGYIEGSNIGAIVPRIVPAGTITRRGVEPTWLTASNAYTDRIGSELKSMVQSPPGYTFVGADVDSQELWIGAILGDANFGQSHGCTALGWMTIQGNKKDATDLHSRVAQTVNISRDHAKVFNYGRIYGAGQQFAEKLLQQFNHRMTVEEAKEKAKVMFSTTKGKRNHQTGRWYGGSESSMFNKLEEIAREDQPCTPVLGCRISKALEPDNVLNDFMTSRINWVVQSSAVDYLHLILVCMRWLIEEYDINGRFSISIHDEVRYLVEEEDKYRAALALQVTNLLTRSMFSYTLGMNDLPLSVAFFSAVDIDQCLRKEVTMDCVTPSNPHGLEKGYQIPEGEALDIEQIIQRTGGLLKKLKPDVIHHEPVLTSDVIHHEPVLTSDVIHHEPVLTSDVIHHEPVLTSDVIHHEPVLTSDSQTGQDEAPS